MKKLLTNLITELAKQSERLHDISIRLEAMEQSMEKNHPADLIEWRRQVEELRQTFVPVRHKSVLNIESIRALLPSVQD